MHSFIKSIGTWAAVVVALSLSTTFPAYSQQSNKIKPTSLSLADLTEKIESEVEAADIVGRLDLSIPSSPAFSVLGFTPENVIRPDSPQELAVGLLQGLDHFGEDNYGFSIDTRPFLIFGGDKITLQQYKTERAKRFLANLQLSAASVSASENNTKRYSVGLRYSHSDNDIRLDADLASCVNPEIQSILESTDADTLFGEMALINSGSVSLKDNKKLSSCYKGALERTEKRWNAGGFDVGLAFMDVDSDLGSDAGVAFWASKSWKTSSNGQLIIHGRYSKDLVTIDSKAAEPFSVSDEELLALRYRHGRADRALLFEASHSKNKLKLGDSKDISTLLIGAELKLADRVWFQLSIADHYGDVADEEDPVFSGNFRWGLGKSSLR